jgi:hypothetical protein
VSETDKSHSLFDIVSSIVVVIVWGILFIGLGVWFLSNPRGIVIYLWFMSYGALMLEIEIILLCGIVFIIIGIIILTFGLIKSLIITPKKFRGHIEEKKIFEEKQNYMNPSWLKHQYYDLGISLQDIANEQRVSIITIRKWVDKLGLVSEDLGTSE